MHIDYKNDQIQVVDAPLIFTPADKSQARAAEALAESTFRVCPSCGSNAVTLQRGRHLVTPEFQTTMGTTSRWMTCKSVRCESCLNGIIRVFVKSKSHYFSSIPDWRKTL